MNTAAAIKHLKSIGFFVEPLAGKLYNIRRIGTSDHPWYSKGARTARELINFARVYSSENNQHTAIKKNVKRCDKAKNRAATRNLLNTRDEERIDLLGPKVKAKQEDIWMWD